MTPLSECHGNLTRWKHGQDLPIHYLEHRRSKGGYVEDFGSATLASVFPGLVSLAAGTHRWSHTFISPPLLIFLLLPRFPSGRGFGRGRVPFTRGGFQGARGSHFRGRARGRAGRFSFPPDDNIEGSHFEFRGGRSFARGTDAIIPGLGDSLWFIRPGNLCWQRPVICSVD